MINIVLFMALFVLLDQYSKIWVLAHVGLRKLQILPFLDFVTTWNKGISYGWFSSQEWAHKSLLTLNILITLVLLILTVRAKSAWQKFCFILITSGALGNLIDRFTHGAVLDFISIHAGRFHWYVFNLADVWITLGALGILWHSFSNRNKTGDPSSCAS